MEKVTDFSLRKNEKLLCTDSSPACPAVEEHLGAAIRSGAINYYEDVEVMILLSVCGRVFQRLVCVETILAKVNSDRNGLFNGVVLDDGVLNGGIVYGGRNINAPRFVFARPLFTPYTAPLVEDFLIKEKRFPFKVKDPEDPQFFWDSDRWMAARYSFLKAPKPNTDTDFPQTQRSTIS